MNACKDVLSRVLGLTAGKALIESPGYGFYLATGNCENEKTRQAISISLYITSLNFVMYPGFLPHDTYVYKQDKCVTQTGQVIIAANGSR